MWVTFPFQNLLCRPEPVPGYIDRPGLEPSASHVAATGGSGSNPGCCVTAACWGTSVTVVIWAEARGYSKGSLPSHGVQTQCCDPSKGRPLSSGKLELEKFQNKRIRTNRWLFDECQVEPGSQAGREALGSGQVLGRHFPPQARGCVSRAGGAAGRGAQATSAGREVGSSWICGARCQEGDVSPNVHFIVEQMCSAGG